MVKRTVQKKKSEAGQAVLIVVAAISIFLLGAVGLAVDGSNLYAQRQAAQAAADAAAQAGIVSVFNGSSGLTSASAYWCTVSDTTSPCVYARTNGFGVSATSTNCTSGTPANDCIYVEPNPSGVTVSNLSNGFPINLVRVTITRPVGMTLMRMLGLTSGTVRANATAAIVDVMSPVPILVTHPSNPGTFAFNGGVTIKICGGPGRSIQVNSTNNDPQSGGNLWATQGISGNSNMVDLSQAGPNDSGNCTTGTGGGFGDAGGPILTTASGIEEPFFNLSCINATPTPNTCAASSDVYYQGATDPIKDPLANVPPPDKPSTSYTSKAPSISLSGGTSCSNCISTTYNSSGGLTCPSTDPYTGVSVSSCGFYLPGDYTNGIQAKGSSGYIAYFFPGVYYMDTYGFQAAANGNMEMYPGANPDTSSTPCGTGSGMLVYNTGSGLFVVGSNAYANLVGSDDTSCYKGILFFEDRNAPANTQKNNTHIFGGNGAMSLTGTIYINNSLSVMTNDPTHYQLVQLQGGGGSNTLLKGEIIVNELLLGGTGTILMNLNPAAVAPVHQIALVPPM